LPNSRREADDNDDNELNHIQISPIKLNTPTAKNKVNSQNNRNYYYDNLLDEEITTPIKDNNDISIEEQFLAESNNKNDNNSSIPIEESTELNTGDDTIEHLYDTNDYDEFTSDYKTGTHFNAWAALKEIHETRNLYFDGTRRRERNIFNPEIGIATTTLRPPGSIFFWQAIPAHKITTNSMLFEQMATAADGDCLIRCLLRLKNIQKYDSRHRNMFGEPTDKQEKKQEVSEVKALRLELADYFENNSEKFESLDGMDRELPILRKPKEWVDDRVCKIYEDMTGIKIIILQIKKQNITTGNLVYDIEQPEAKQDLKLINSQCYVDRKIAFVLYESSNSTQSGDAHEFGHYSPLLWREDLQQFASLMGSPNNIYQSSLLIPIASHINNQFLVTEIQYKPNHGMDKLLQGNFIATGDIVEASYTNEQGEETVYEIVILATVFELEYSSNKTILKAQIYGVPFADEDATQITVFGFEPNNIRKITGTLSVEDFSEFVLKECMWEVWEMLYQKEKTCNSEDFITNENNTEDTHSDKDDSCSMEEFLNPQSKSTLTVSPQLSNASINNSRAEGELPQLEGQNKGEPAPTSKAKQNKKREKKKPDTINDKTAKFTNSMRLRARDSIAPPKRIYNPRTPASKKQKKQKLDTNLSEVENFNDNNNSGSSSKKKRKRTPRKGFISPFALFMKLNKEDIREELNNTPGAKKGKNAVKLHKVASTLWAALTGKQREEWIDLAAEHNAKHYHGPKNQPQAKSQSKKMKGSKRKNELNKQNADTEALETINSNSIAGKKTSKQPIQTELEDKVEHKAEAEFQNPAGKAKNLRTTRNSSNEEVQDPNEIPPERNSNKKQKPNNIEPINLAKIITQATVQAGTKQAEILAGSLTQVLSTVLNKFNESQHTIAKQIKTYNRPRVLSVQNLIQRSNETTENAGVKDNKSIKQQPEQKLQNIHNKEKQDVEEQEEQYLRSPDIKTKKSKKSLAIEHNSGSSQLSNSSSTSSSTSSSSSSNSNSSSDARKVLFKHSQRTKLRNERERLRQQFELEHQIDKLELANRRDDSDFEHDFMLVAGNSKKRKKKKHKSKSSKKHKNKRQKKL